jgi:RNA polymerase sigma factor for flagellar operon FliA
VHRAEARYSLPKSDAELLTRYATLIDRVAWRVVARVGMPNGDELWSVGALGLLEAARRFDGERDVRFETFAEHRIRGAMLDELRNMDHLPRRLRADAEKAVKARNALGHELGREATSDEVAAKLGIEVSELAELEQLRQPALPILDALSVPSPEDGADAKLDRALRSKRLATAIGKLPERLQTLLQLYYVEELTFKEIAKVLQVSEARVCQLHGESVQKLRGLLE